MPPQRSSHHHHQRSRSHSSTRHHLPSGTLQHLHPTVVDAGGTGGTGGDTTTTSIYQNGYMTHLLDCDDEQAAVERATRAFELDAAKERLSDERELREFAKGVFRLMWVWWDGWSRREFRAIRRERGGVSGSGNGNGSINKQQRFQKVFTRAAAKKAEQKAVVVEESRGGEDEDDDVDDENDMGVISCSECSDYDGGGSDINVPADGEQYDDDGDDGGEEEEEEKPVKKGQGRRRGNANGKGKGKTGKNTEKFVVVDTVCDDDDDYADENDVFGTRRRSFAEHVEYGFPTPPEDDRSSTTKTTANTTAAGIKKTQRGGRVSRYNSRSAITKPKSPGATAAAAAATQIHHHHHHHHHHGSRRREDDYDDNNFNGRRGGGGRHNPHPTELTPRNRNPRLRVLSPSTITIPHEKQRTLIKKMAGICLHSLFEFTKRHNLPITFNIDTPYPYSATRLTIQTLTDAIIAAYNRTPGAGALPDGVIWEDIVFGFVGVFEAAGVLDDAVMYRNVVLEDWRIRGVLASGVDLLAALRDKKARRNAEVLWRKCEAEILKGMVAAAEEIERGGWFKGMYVDDYDEDEDEDEEMGEGGGGRGRRGRKVGLMVLMGMRRESEEDVDVVGGSPVYVCAFEL
ncbi:hypothetical protein DFH27DRAFT_528231 [Peziza echinospora]|nr:hypothetical protein DFH27DRAFT_528231 [Peziza echinospora]